MSHTRNGTRTRAVPALTATGITILDRSAAQRHKENSLVLFYSRVAGLLVIINTKQGEMASNLNYADILSTLCIDLLTET